MESTATPPIPATGSAGPATTVASKKATKRARKDQARTVSGAATQVRQSRVEMSRVDLWSALKVSLCFYLAGLTLLIVAGVVAWLLLDAAGQLRQVESFMGDIVSAKDYHFVGSQVLLGSVLVGLVLVALMTILTVVAAALYNVFSELVGGVEVTLTEAN